MRQSYIDRYGQPHPPTKKISTSKREGAWLVCVHHERVLLNHPYYAPDVPDLPGGGIDAGETAQAAALRELNEESGLSLKNPSIAATFNQKVYFYAEDVPAYWHYDQTFLLIDTGLQDVYFEGVKQVPEGHSEWIPLSRLHQYRIHHFHKKALAHFGLIDTK